jgi:hypothetical protein
VTRLPVNILLILLKTWVRKNARPRILRIVALELDDQIQDKIWTYTGKEN